MNSGPAVWKGVSNAATGWASRMPIQGTLAEDIGGPHGQATIAEQSIVWDGVVAAALVLGAASLVVLLS